MRVSDWLKDAALDFIGYVLSAGLLEKIPNKSFVVILDPNKITFVEEHLCILPEDRYRWFDVISELFEESVALNYALFYTDVETTSRGSAHLVLSISGVQYLYAQPLTGTSPSRVQQIKGLPNIPK